MRRMEGDGPAAGRWRRGRTAARRAGRAAVHDNGPGPECAAARRPDGPAPAARDSCPQAKRPPADHHLHRPPDAAAVRPGRPRGTVDRIHGHRRLPDANRHLQHHRQGEGSLLQHLPWRLDALHAAADHVGRCPALGHRHRPAGLARLHSPAACLRHPSVPSHQARRPRDHRRRRAVAGIDRAPASVQAEPPAARDRIG